MEPDDALRDLRQIRQVMEQTRRSLAAGGSGQALIIWGLVWVLGFSGDQFLDASIQRWSWLALVTLGIIASLVLGIRQGSKIRGGTGWRIGAFWFALFLYASLWQWILSPATELPGALFIITVAMFGYVVMGLWLSNFLTGLGLAVTLLAFVGAYLLPFYFSIWMALLGGGTLIVSGVYIHARWR